MALDFFAISSQGVYPTPTPTGAIRAALAVSQGLLNITLPSPAESTVGLVSIIVGKVKDLFMSRHIHL